MTAVMDVTWQRLRRSMTPLNPVKVEMNPLPFVILMLLFAASPARAQTVRARALESVEIVDHDDGQEIRVRLGFPVQYLRHGPLERGPTLEILFKPLDIGSSSGGTSAARDSSQGRESLRPAPGKATVLEEVIFDGRASLGPSLELRFARSVRFRVEPGSDFRTISVRLAPRPKRPAAEAPAPPRPGQSPGSGAATGTSAVEGATGGAAGSEGGRGQLLLGEARRAMTANELDRAIALLTKVLDEETPGVAAADRLAARELLGVARERRGQRAHARAEYETYLRLHPDGPGAQRVRQRLAALDTAEAPPMPALRETPARFEEESGYSFEGYGSVSASYARLEDISEQSSGTLYDQSVTTDVYSIGRIESDRFRFEAEAVGSYRFVLMDDRSNDATVSSLFVDVEDRELQLEGRIGRQRRSNGGVLGRVDGVRLAAAVWDGVWISAIGGFPVASTADAPFDTDRTVFGLAIDADGLPANIDLQIFGVGQTVDGEIDRSAIGLELRHVAPGRYALLFLDYDFILESLNTALLSGHVRVRDDLDLNFFAETRNSPILTLSRALVGQNTASIETLGEIYSDSELLDLARDRTPRLWSGSVGLSHRTTPLLQLAGDVRVASLSGTPTSGGVPGTDGTGLDVGASFQAIRSSILVRGDVGNATLSVFFGEYVNLYGLTLGARFPIGRRVRLSPRLRMNYRQHSGAGDDGLGVDPSMRVSFQWDGFSFESELGVDWTNYLEVERDDDLDYYANVVFRYDF